MVGMFLARAVAIEEKLLDNYLAVEAALKGKVGDAKTALTQFALDLVFAILQGAAWL